ncbi:Homeobox domain-containing protein [Apiospora marii]|uniref:Homeobox domain-containing protein n=1 Tax=Apiospora marii TaxID=335849 RepID=UPI0031328C54
MLVTRQIDTEQSHWSSKYGALYTSPRMSNFDSSLTTQPEWQGHYSFLPPGESNLFVQPFEQGSGSNSSNETSAAQQQRPANVHTTALSTQPNQDTPGSPHGHGRSLDPLGLRAPKVESPTQESSDPRIAPSYRVKAEPARDGSTEASRLTHETAVTSPSGTQGHGEGAGDNDDLSLGKEEDDDVLDDDDDMIEGEGDPNAPPQTAAERTAARRKMKRFRLTHQQTRFLMSEFAKQPHPDAAHRERLSREIPGLSPRQVQVWFQNRRAKIKRLTADDRDRMIKMRAVPDDFDNVQALHSPYGAVHTLGTPITPPVDFGNPASYADHMMRPLMLDTIRRSDAEEHMSPTGLSPGFGGMGFATSGPMGHPDILSPLSPPSTDRGGYYSSHLASPMSSGPRTSNPFARQNSLETGMPMHSSSRQPIRPLQPLQLRETMSRSRSETLQSPLRSSMSWKGDSIDFNSYQPGSSSPVAGNRHQSVYQPDQMSGGAGSPMGYDSGSYSSNPVQSPTSHMGYSSLHGSTLQPPPSNRSRLRAASATLPLGLDLRTQYRSVSGLPPTGAASSMTPRSATTAPYGNSTSYTTSFPSAPLSAPIEFSLPRTPGSRPVHDYSMPQISAPIAPPHDFSQALHGNMTSPTSRTPMRDSFGGNSLASGQGRTSNDRSDDYSQDSYGSASSVLKRKRSLSISQAGHAGPGPQPYGHST